MKTLVQRFSLSLLILLLTVFVSAQKPEQAKIGDTNSQTKPSEYTELVKKAKSGDPTIDFVKFRAAYLDWISDECNQTDAPRRDEMVKAFEAKNWSQAAELAENVLDYEFVNRGLHLATANAYKELKNTEKEKYHADIARKLFKAILDSGDGKTAKTAFKVHSIREEYQVMRELGYQVSMQSLVFDKEYGSFDVLSGQNAEKKEGSFYFDINSFFGGGQSKPCKDGKDNKKN